MIRAVITPNFDNLIEKALAKRGVPVQVLATENDFETAAPLIHCAEFRVYKPHGTLGRGKLRNTPADIGALPPVITNGLLRAIDDHGLIVQGYAGEDGGILDVLARRRKSLYPVFWLSSGPPNSRVVAACGSDLVHVPSTSASKSLREMIYLYGELTAIAPEHRPAARLAEIETLVRTGAASAPAEIRDFIASLKTGLQELAPNLVDAQLNDELIVQALEKSVDYVRDFGRLFQFVAANDRPDCVHEIYDAFAPLKKLTNADLGRLQLYVEENGDFGRFIVFELFVMFIAALVKNRRWPALSEVLGKDLYDPRHGPFGFRELNEYAKTLDEWRNRRLGLNRLSVMHDMIEQRHRKGGVLNAVASQEELEDADYLLMLRTSFRFRNRREAEGSFGVWVPRAMLGMDRLPEFLGRCASSAFAHQILPVLGVASCDELKAKLREFRDYNQHIYRRGFTRSPGDFRRDFIDEICSRP